MPSPKTGTVTNDILKAIEDVKGVRLSLGLISRAGCI